DRPRAIGGLAPGRPVERDVDPHAGQQALAGEAVRRLPRQVAEQHVDVQVLLDGVPLEQGVFQGLAHGADGDEEEVVEHDGPAYGRTLTIMTNPWAGRRVLNYAHQGGAREAPSSTLFAM